MSSVSALPLKLPRTTESGPFVGRYELLSRLAVGGMGEVYIARRRRRSGREERVALKLLLPQLAREPGFVQMFLDEARIASRMDHPNVVRLHDYGQAGGHYFIAMQLVQGVSLSALLRACRKQKTFLPLKVARLIARGLLDGLHHTHTQTGPLGMPLGIVHRDVSPQNLLLSSSGDVVLTDFGIAKASDNVHRTEIGELRGKYAYMAPEQMRSSPKLDRRADIFAAAATLFEVFSLVSPFARDTDPATVEAVLRSPPPDILELRPEVGLRAADALRRALSRDPAKRFATARDFADALLDGDVAEPRKLGRWVRELCPDQLSAFDTRLAERPQLVRPAPAPSFAMGIGVTPRKRSRITWRHRLAGATAFMAVMALGVVGAWRLSVSPAPGRVFVPAPASAPARSDVRPAAPAPAPAASPAAVPAVREDVAPAAAEEAPAATTEEAPAAEPALKKGRPSVHGHDQTGGRRGMLRRARSAVAQL